MSGYVLMQEAGAMRKDARSSQKDFSQARPLPDSRYSLIHSRAIPDPDPYLYVGLCLICRRAMLGHISSGYTWFFVYH